MKFFNWNLEKNEWLKQNRKISFEEIVVAISEGFAMEVFDHPNQTKYKGQKVFSILINGYIYLVPFVENENEIFLKTIIPSRKATKKHLKL